MAISVPSSSGIYTYNIECRRGDSLNLELDIIGNDFTGYTFRFDVVGLYDKRLILRATPTIVSVTTTDDVITTRISIVKSATQTLVQAGMYRYDFAAIAPGDSPDRDYVGGSFRIIDDASNNVPNYLEDLDNGIIVG